MRFIVLVSLTYSVLSASDSILLSNQIIVKSEQNPVLTKSINLSDNKNLNSNQIFVAQTKQNSVPIGKAASQESGNKQKDNKQKQSQLQKKNKSFENKTQVESGLPIVKTSLIGSLDGKQNKIDNTVQVSKKNVQNQKQQPEQQPEVHQMKQSPKKSSVQKKDSSKNAQKFTFSSNAVNKVPSDSSPNKKQNKPEEKAKASQVDTNLGKQLRSQPLPEKIVTKDLINLSDKKQSQTSLKTSSSPKTTKKIEPVKNLPQLPKVLPAKTKQEPKVTKQVKVQENTKPKGIQIEPVHKIQNQQEQAVQTKTQVKSPSQGDIVTPKVISPNLQKTPQLTVLPQNPQINLDPFSQSKRITIDSQNNLSTSETNIYKGKQNYLDGVSNNVLGNLNIINNGNFNTIEGNSNTIHNGENNHIISNGNFVHGSGNVVN